MPITSGSIEYERRLNLGEYNHKNVVAKISWTVEPNEEDNFLADQAIRQAVARVAVTLNCVVNMTGKPFVNLAFEEPKLENKAEPTSELAPNIENIAVPDLATAVAEITAGIPPALKRHRRTKAEMEAARAAEANPTLTPEIPTVSDGADPRHDPPSEPGMPSFDPEPTPPVDVTDQALLDACQVKASSGKSVADIKELVAKFSPGGLVQTPKDARCRFLEELAKL